MLQLVLSAFYMCGPGCEQGNWPVRRKMLSKTYSSPHTARNILPIHNSTWSLRPATSTLADDGRSTQINRLNPELNPICYLLALLGAHHFLHVSRIRVKLLTFRLLMSHIYGAPIHDVSRSHTTTQHSR